MFYNWLHFKFVCSVYQMSIKILARVDYAEI